MKIRNQLFTLRNIIPMLTIILAFLGVSGLIKSSMFPTDKLILALLGVLAIDTVVVRFGYLSRIEDSIKSLSLTTSKPLFVNRATLNSDESFEQFVSRGRDVVIVGITLVGTVGPLRTLLKTTMQQGTILRFLLLDPESTGIQLAARSHGVSPESLRNDILSSLGHLRQLMDSRRGNKGGSLEVRLLNAIPDAGIVVCDGNRDTGEIRYEMYLFQTDAAGRPAFRLRATEGEIFRRFCDAVERAWDDSVSWVPKPST